jgi:hypothetical protein
MSDRLEYVEESLRAVIETLNDGHKGFSESGKHIQDPSIKTFFIEKQGADSVRYRTPGSTITRF